MSTNRIRNSPAKYSKLLRLKLQIPMEPLLKRRRIKQNSAYDIKQDPNFSKWYVTYIQTLHTILRASVPLMRSAYEKTVQLDNDTAELLANYYEKHIDEEMHHDEWLLDDLEAMGISREGVIMTKPSLAVAELVGSQYYWIYHWHPVTLLGYIAVLEGYPIEREELQWLQKKAGFNDKAFRTLAKHSYLDPNHKNDLDMLLDKLPLSAREQQYITVNAIETAYKLTEIV